MIEITKQHENNHYLTSTITTHTHEHKQQYTHTHPILIKQCNYKLNHQISLQTSQIIIEWWIILETNQYMIIVTTPSSHTPTQILHTPNIITTHIKSQIKPFKQHK